MPQRQTRLQQVREATRERFALHLTNRPMFPRLCGPRINRCVAGRIFPLEIVKLLRQRENAANYALAVPKGIAAQLASLADFGEPTLHDIRLRVLEPLPTAERLKMIFPNVPVPLVC